MVMVVLPDTGECISSACLRQDPLGQAAANIAGGGQIAVATRQKSTARRLVRICAVLEDTPQMLFTRGAAVTLTVLHRPRPGRYRPPRARPTFAAGPPPAPRSCRRQRARGPWVW